MKKVIFLIIVLLFIVSCSTEYESLEDWQEDKFDEVSTTEVSEEIENEVESEEIEDEIESDWMKTELIDIKTNEIFTIDDYAGQLILLESFAVWCPVCTRQQDEIKDLHALRDDFVSISLDTDPNEDAEKILDHIERNEFDWYYAISPIDLTTELINEFGISVVNAPGAPLILICEDQSSRFLESGVKTAEELEEEILEGC